MSTITVDEVGIFRCKFKELKPCKNNSDYLMAVLYFENSIDGKVVDWNSLFSRPQYLLHKAEDVNHLSSLEEGKVYLFKCAVGYNSGSQKDGKSYAPGVKYTILETLKEVS